VAGPVGPRVDPPNATLEPLRSAAPGA
jgi:hypothetical protein